MTTPLRRNAEVLEEHLPVAGRSLLDLGAGTGALARLLARRGGEVTALEPQVALVRQAAAKSAGERHVAGRAEILPFAAGSFDLAIFFNALHHVPLEAMDAALAEARRVLRPEGTLAVLEPIAAGKHFELMRPLEDETLVRAAAAEALGRLVARGEARRRLCLEYDAPVVFADFAEWRRAMVTVDPARALRLAGQEATLAERFAALAEPDPAGGHLFRQPTRFELFTRK